MLREDALSRVLDEVLEFWFGPPGGNDGYEKRKIWFEKDSAFDAEVRARFLDAHEAAAAGAFDTLADEPRRALALVIALDQFPRNMFRGSPRAYATDGKALAAATAAIERGFDLGVHHVPRLFFYLPYEHSEDLAVQRRSLDLYQRLADDPEHDRSMYYARRHCEIIERFGRFPHRNAVLGRETTPAEAEFLKEKDASF
ncbi:MAG: DUF924 family protein [Alphaproteobacteria bacterium]